tara:strand:+ start:4146 stop:4814 length:669 start_codon:yes stop_codon:yes gene_type:complete
MVGKQLEDRKIRIKKILKILKKEFPKAMIALNFRNNWELFVAVVLSAQCTDKRVNIVTKDLFKKYKKLDDYVNADLHEFEQDIKPTGFFRNKAKNILAAAKMVKEEFGGKLPKTMEEMLTIPGAARKTANVVLSNAYGLNFGIAVDTHVKRFTQRFNLSDYKDPIRIERDLMEIVPKKDWGTITYLLIEYGRHICPARVHDCKSHPLTKIYPKAVKLWPKTK